MRLCVMEYASYALIHIPCRFFFCFFFLGGGGGRGMKGFTPTEEGGPLKLY